MARRRRKKTSPARTLFLWTVSLTLITWGLWQAWEFTRSIAATSPLPPMAFATTDPAPDTAPASAPWAVATVSADHQDNLLDRANAGLELPRQADYLRATPAFDASLSVAELISQGGADLAAGRTAAGRYALNEALTRTADEAQAAQLRQALTAINRPIFLSSALLPEDPSARLVTIHLGDTYLTIARTYGITVAFLQILNPTLNPNNLKPDTGIKIVQGPFAARVVKHANRLDLYARDQYVASFTVDFPEGNYLPRGEYQVAPGTKLQLAGGARSAAERTWIGFRGIDEATEGVTNGWLFGTAGPRGNDAKNRATGIHLADGDMQQLYNTLTESHSRVTVLP